MDRKRKREVALAAVAVVAVGVAAYRIRTMQPTPYDAGQTASTGPASQQRPMPQHALTDLDLTALRSTRPGPVGATRDPFRFKPKPAPPPRAANPAPVQPVPTAPVTPPPPPIALKFIGTIESPRTGKIAVLSDPRGVYQGHEGETIEGRYRIVRIGVESVELAYLDGRGRQTIRLSGQ